MPILNTIPNVPEPPPKAEPVDASTTGKPTLTHPHSQTLTDTHAHTAGAGVDSKSLDAIHAKLQQAQEDKQKQTGQELTTLQQEENVSISGSNARLMIMKKLSRKSEVGSPRTCM